MLLELGDHFAEKQDIKSIDFDEDAATRPDKIFNFLTSRYCDMESQNLAICVNVIRGSSSLGTTWYQWSAFENPPSICQKYSRESIQDPSESLPHV
jgi:hypothetical protein